MSDSKAKAKKTQSKMEVNLTKQVELMNLFSVENEVDLLAVWGMHSVYLKHNKRLESVISFLIDGGFNDEEIAQEVNKKGGLSDAFAWFDKHPEVFSKCNHTPTSTKDQ